MTTPSTKSMHWLRPLLVTLLTLLMASIYMYWNLCGELRGNIDWFMKTTKVFGIPEVMVEHQQTPLYQDNINTGWDTQFYFFMASDLLGVTDAPQHIDNPVYRYQRVGLPLTAAVVAKVSGQTWVSPKIYYFTNLVLILLSTFFLATFFQSRNYSPWWALCWSLSFGVQLGLNIGLPDAAAEAYLALMLIAYVNKRYWWYMLLATLTALTREAFIMIPAVLFGCHVVDDWRQGRLQAIFTSWKKYIALIVPGILFLAWQIYIRVHFHASPSTTVHNAHIVAWPLQSLSHALGFYIQQINPFPLSAFISAQATWVSLALVFFAMLMLLYITLMIYWLVTCKSNNHIRVILIATLAFLLLNLCLGDTVMMGYIGGLKAINVVVLLIPFLACVLHVKLRPIITVILILYVALGIGLMTRQLWNKMPSSVTAQFSVPLTHETLPTSIPCQPSASIRLHINAINKINFFKHPFFDKNYDYYLVKLTIQNTGDKVLQKTEGLGNFDVSYLIYLKNVTQPVLDNPRTFLVRPLAPHSSATMNIQLILPKGFSFTDNKVVFTMVQEGCAWLYLTNPSNGVTLNPQDLQNMRVIDDINLMQPLLSQT